MARATLKQIQQAAQRQQAKEAAERKRTEATQARAAQRRGVQRAEEVATTFRLKREARLKAALGR